MLFRIVLVIVSALTLYSIKGFFKKPDWTEVKEAIDKFGVGAVGLALGILMSITSIPYFIFYAMAYSLSPLLQWLSAIQIVMTLYSVIKSFGYASKINKGEFKSNIIRRIFLLAFEVVYIYLVVMAIF